MIHFLLQKQVQRFFQQPLFIAFECVQCIFDEVVLVSAHAVILDVEFDTVVTITDSQPFQGSNKLFVVLQRGCALQVCVSFLEPPIVPLLANG